MRVIRFLEGGEPRYGAVEGDTAYPFAAAPWDDPVPAARGVQVAGLLLLPPCSPSKIVCIGKNYRGHAKEMEGAAPDEPLIFLKPPSALVASGEPIVRPRGYERVDYEGELAVVIGRLAHRVKREEALDYVFGYTCFNDVTVRDLQKKDVQYTRAKGFDTFAPIGPCIATEPDPAGFTIATRLNGEVRQEAAAAEMVFDVPALVCFVSRVMTLLPGDVIATGTPAGVGNLRPGDVVDVDISGIGTLHNPVIEEEWER
jgi:2-keto-4-pentenoate hydratase/2-oxohepta-3-ene-1,7-dioic acid hydratase in catechol pathway